MRTPVIIPKVSIGVPVYNDVRYLSASLESLLQQTYANFELIIGDNSSTDGTAELCLQAQRDDPRVRYHRHPQNIGPQMNFTFLLDSAVGEYFMWAASDDWRDPDFLRCLVELLDADNDAASAFSPFGEIDENGLLVTEALSQDYSSETSIGRLWRFWSDHRPWRDVWIYGLHRRKFLAGTSIPKWWWPNANIATHCAFPVLSKMLVLGKYAYYSDRTLFKRRVHPNSKPRHSIREKPHFLKNVFATLVLQLNLTIETLTVIWQTSHSVRTLTFSAPIIVYDRLRLIASYLVHGLRNKLMAFIKLRWTH